MNHFGVPPFMEPLISWPLPAPLHVDPSNFSLWGACEKAGHWPMAVMALQAAVRSKAPHGSGIASKFL